MTVHFVGTSTLSKHVEVGDTIHFLDSERPFTVVAVSNRGAYIRDDWKFNLKGPDPVEANERFYQFIPFSGG